MDAKKTTIIAIAATYLLIKKKKRTKRRNPSIRVNSYLKERSDKGRFSKDFEDLKNHKQGFYENFHMDANSFEKIFSMVEPYIKPKRYTRKDCLEAKLKFAVAIEYFASGSLQRHMASIYRISKQHLGKVIDDVCVALIEVLKSEVPQYTKEQCLKWSEEYNNKWQFPNCIGAIDGKHCAIKSPNNAGSLFYNYKGFHSIVLMAVADANYKFTYLDIGAYGSEGDANVFSSSKFGQHLLADKFDFPKDVAIQGENIPFFYLADDAFPLCKRILKPYGGKQNLSEEEKIFNYRLSRARRCVENAFGILCWKWLCQKRTMLCSPDRAHKIITACCLLHNFLITNGSSYCSSNTTNVNILENLPEQEFAKNIENSLYNSPLSTVKGRPTEYGKWIRKHLTSFFSSPEGAVPWQKASSYLK